MEKNKLFLLLRAIAVVEHSVRKLISEVIYKYNLKKKSTFVIARSNQAT
ncbi:MAG: hypothetical protein AB4080_23000 [Trichodesmium sp.]